MATELVNISFTFAADTDEFDTTDPEEIVDILQGQIDSGELDVSDLIDEDADIQVRVAE